MNADRATAAGRYRADYLHQPAGWYAPGYLEITADGLIGVVSDRLPEGWDEAGLIHLDGYVVPGMIDVHSHAHQRALAGHAEGVDPDPAASADDFWTWRNRMYALVGVLDPEQFEAIAAQLYLEMLCCGYTTVGEFHYLHQDPNGNPYADPAEMSHRVIAAAEQTRIALTLLPALYNQGGIGKPPAPGQRRFVHDSVDAFLGLVEDLQSATASRPWLRVGVAPHSLRAVDSEALSALIEAVNVLDYNMPIHIHVAEQTGEVEECIEHLGDRPVSWLLDHLPVDDRWTLIHATHTDDDELRRIAGSGATVGLCPITEADLGDGVFGLATYHRAGGRWGIGSDGNTVLDPAQELRQLEYSQRLTQRHRAILVDPAKPETAHPGRLLYDLALAGGALSLRQPVGSIEPGKRADLVLLDPNHPALAGHGPDTVMDAWIFGHAPGLVRDVCVGGSGVIRDRHHPHEDEITQRFREVVRQVWT